MNIEKTGFISQFEFQFLMEHWGIQLTTEQMQRIFSRFDKDKDNMLSWNDLHSSIGNTLHPPEQLYFRQDQKMQKQKSLCKEHDCYKAPIGYQTMCIQHLKS
jgi:Ca2+-binding EF-hand superfamily protein|tara:strand:- start:211 stop:516 length:306 start_codon:yes stop_codon:yes gene_type:complete